MNPKRVHRLMREDNLLCVRKRKFVVTTDSNHTRKVYPNLARDMVPTAINQLWRADITYIRLRDEFVFLAVILDALLAPRDRLGAGSHDGRFAHAHRATHGARAPRHRARPGASFRPRFAVRQQRLHGSAQTTINTCAKMKLIAFILYVHFSVTFNEN